MDWRIGFIFDLLTIKCDILDCLFWFKEVILIWFINIIKNFNIFK